MNSVSEYRPSIKRGLVPPLMEIDFTPDQLLRLTLLECPRTALPQIVLQLYKLIYPFNQMNIHLSPLSWEFETRYYGFPLNKKSLSHCNGQGWKIIFHFPIREGQYSLFRFYHAVNISLRAFRPKSRYIIVGISQRLCRVTRTSRRCGRSGRAGRTASNSL
jgi:hypothetical protein